MVHGLLVFIWVGGYFVFRLVFVVVAVLAVHLIIPVESSIPKQNLFTLPSELVRVRTVLNDAFLSIFVKGYIRGVRR